MSDDLTGAAAPDADSAAPCPWCSAPLGAVDAVRCPACNAALREGPETDVPGVTTIDHEAILRSRQPLGRSSGLMGWLVGGSRDESGLADPALAGSSTSGSGESIQPPDDEVRREMIRLKLAAIETRLEAERAELQAQRQADAADRSIAEPEPTVGPLAGSDPASETGQGTDAATPGSDRFGDEASAPPG